MSPLIGEGQSRVEKLSIRCLPLRVLFSHFLDTPCYRARKILQEGQFHIIQVQRRNERNVRLILECQA